MSQTETEKQERRSIVDELTDIPRLERDFHNRVRAGAEVITLDRKTETNLEELSCSDGVIPVRANKTRGAGYQRVACFKEGEVAEQFAARWPEVSAASRFFSRGVRKNYYRAALTEEEIDELEEKVTGHISDEIDALKAKEQELLQTLAEFGLSEQSVTCANVFRLNLMIETAEQALMVDLAEAADNVSSLLHVLDTLYYRRGLTRSQSSEMTQKGVQNAMNTLGETTLFLVRSSRKTSRHCETQARQARQEREKAEKTRKAREEEKQAEDRRKEAEKQELSRKADEILAEAERRRLAEKKAGEERVKRQAKEKIEADAEYAKEAFATHSVSTETSGEGAGK